MTLTAVTLQGELKFDSTERSGFMLEPNDPEWGLCDHGPFLSADYRDDDEEDYEEERDEYDEPDAYGAGAWVPSAVRGLGAEPCDLRSKAMLLRHRRELMSQMTQETA